MATDRQTISNVIVARLKTVPDLHNNVFDYNPAEIRAFPCAAVIGTGHDEVIADNASDLRLYDFSVIIYLERGKQGFGTEKSERIRRELEDNILAVFDNYQTLGDTVLWSRMKSGGWGYSPDNTMAFFILNLTAYKQVLIS